MKTQTIIFLLSVYFIISIGSYAQPSDDIKYRIEFTNKHNTPYSLNNPQEYLSVRSIQRRIKQNISIDSTDLPVNQNYIDGVLAIGGKLLTKTKWFNAITIVVADTNIIPTIHSLPYVANIEKIFPGSGAKKKHAVEKNEGNHLFLPVNPFYANILDAKRYIAEKFSMKTFNYGFGYNQVNMIGVDYLHAIGYTGDGMIISVLDAGFSNADNLSIFDSLYNSGRILGTCDFVLPGGNVYYESSHGTSVLSVMGGNIPGLLIGTAPHASYLLLRSEDVSSEYRIEEDNWISAAEFADSIGTDIINSSLGYTDFWEPEQNYTYADMNGNTARSTKGANMASAKGILVVNSAGNSGNSPWKYIGAPSDGFNVLGVGGVDEFGNIASFSSHGPSYDGRVKPNVVAQAQGTIVATNDNAIAPGNGTSFSAPLIAGASACLWQAHPTLTNVQLLKYIEMSASLYPSSDTLFGYGIPNFAAAHLLILQKINNHDEPFIFIFPNPFEDEIFIIFQSYYNQNVTADIVDINGKVILTIENIKIFKGYNNISIDNLKGTAPGVYFFRIITNEKVYIKRILKI